MAIHKNTEDYICDKFLELMKEKPFYTIKIKELVAYAGIGRSTFYSYFDSIYAVIQKIENDFLAGFLNDEKVISIIIYGKISDAYAQLEFLKNNLRVLSLLCGPNGDSSFSVKLENHLRKLCNTILEKQGKTYNQKQRDYLNSYIAGGVLASLKWWAYHNNYYEIKDLQLLVSIQINDIERILIETSRDK